MDDYFACSHIPTGSCGAASIKQLLTTLADVLPESSQAINEINKSTLRSFIAFWKNSVYYPLPAWTIE